MEKEEFLFDPTNFEQQKAFDIVANTNNSLFIIGKVGACKTTFMKRIQKKINKNFLVLASTGIAALNVGSQTMHSFFGFPLWNTAYLIYLIRIVFVSPLWKRHILFSHSHQVTLCFPKMLYNGE